MIRDTGALVRLFGEHLRTPFDWRTHNCVTFACAAVKAQTGRDIAASLPSWADEAGARALVAARGGIEAAVDAVLSRVPVGLAARGDIGLVSMPNDTAFLVVVDIEGLRGPGERGLMLLPRKFMLKAWSAE